MPPELSPIVGLLSQELEPLVMRALTRFRALLPRELELAVKLSHDNPRVRAHVQRLENALLSACIVAWHSMGSRATQIVVEVSEILLDDVVLDPDAEKFRGGLPPRRYARLVVSNSARITPGPLHALMPALECSDDRPSSARRLQLVEVRDIIAQHQGTLSVSQEPDRGTAFEIYLPTAMPPETSAFHALDAEAKHILYVDDYAAMREVISETLPDAGFRVTCYETGRDALAALQHDPFACDAVITDYRLQGYSGVELLKQIKLLRPDLPVIIISGYVDNALLLAAKEAGAALVVSKDLDLSELCIALGKVLGEAPNEALVTYSEWSKL